MNYQPDAMIFGDVGGLLLLPVGLLAFTFWAWMIVDCARHETEGHMKVAWLLVILFAGVIGAPLYYVIRRRSRPSSVRLQPSLPVYQPWNKQQRIK